jgi:TonB family protein
LIAGLHVAAVVTLTRWSRDPGTRLTQNVVWLNGSMGQPDRPSAKPSAQPQSLSTPLPAVTPPEEDETEDEEQPALARATSDIKLPATPQPTATAKPAVTATAAPKVKVTPPRHPKPKPTAKPSPKPSPKKLVVAKAAARATPPALKSEEVEPKRDSPNETPGPIMAPTATPSSSAAAAEPGGAKGLARGNGGRAGGGAGQGRFGWYGSMLHDRFYSEWVQPGNVPAASGGNSVLVRLRIEKDGRVSSFDIVRPSGNAEIDESVRAAAKRVTQVDPLPTGLGSGEHYDVKIKFELSSD